MSTFLERLEEEKDQLFEKVIKLNEFIEDNPLFNTVSDIQKILLTTQLNVMQIYLYTLQERINDLSPKTSN